MPPKTMNAKMSYVDRHRLHFRVSAMLERILEEQPENPMQRMAEIMLQDAETDGEVEPARSEPTVVRDDSERHLGVGQPANRAETTSAHQQRNDVDLVRESWALVAAGGNLAAVGELFYDVLFTAHPELADTLFRGKDMRAQASKLMAMVDAAVRLLDAPEQLVPVLVSLGERHAGYGVTAEHYPLVGSALLATLHKGLGDKLTEDATAAWGRTFAVIQGAMLEGSSSDGGRRLAAEYAVRQAAPTKRTDVDLVRESWALVAAGGNLAAVGELFYDVLFTAHPELADTLFRGKDMRAQASKLMAMVDAAVRLLDAPEQLVPVLVSLGERHAGYGVTAEHYPVVGSALLATLHKGLGDKLTEDATTAWGRTFAVIQGAMLEGSSSDGGRRLAAEYAVRQAAPTKRTDVDLVRESWALVAAGGNLAAVGELFYDVLFTAHPELADTLFRGKDMRAQASKLMAMVDAAVRLLDAPEQLVPVLVSLGERHAGYGVTAEHYPVVGSALLATLHKGLGDKLTEDATAAWGRTYAVIQGAMLEGSSSDGGRRLAAEYAVRQAAPTKRTDVDLVRESWALVAAGGNLAAVGELFYDVLFTAHPELADTLFRGKDMRAQASKLMAMVDAAVRLLDAPEQLVPVLVSLGERHAGYGVTAEHYPVVGSALLATLHKGLGDKLTEDATAAWGRTFAVIQGAMLEGSSSDGGRRLAAEYAVRQAAPTKRTDVDLVRESWALVAAGGNLAAVGELFYDVLFTAHPELADTLFRGKDMRAQASKLMAMVDAAVRLLDAPEQLVPVLVSLGERHAGYGVTAEHYPVVGSALLATLHKGLGDKLTEDATAAWGRTYAVIQGAMLEGSSSDGGRRLAAEYAVRQAAPTKRTDVDLVRESWALVAAGGNLAAVGELFYDVLFTAHPELADTLFRGKDMRAQASKLMAMVDAAVRLLDAPEQLVPVLVSLGERHAGYGVTAEHYPVVGSALLATLHKGLGDKLTEDATAAWGRTYAVIQGAMLEGSSSDAGRRLAAEYAVRQAAPTKRTDVDLVRESWALVAAGGNLAAVGELFYDVLFTAHPELADTLFRGKDMRAQASKLMAMVDAAVRLLDAPEQLVPVLVSLGERHAGYGVTAEHYPVVGSALLATLHKGLGDKLTEDATAAWGRTFAVIQGAMLEGSSSDAGRRLAAEYAVRQAAPTKRTDVDLVRESWALVAAGGNLAAVGELFYDVLFTAHPELADTLFRGKDMRAQASKLMAMVDAAVRLLDAPEQLVPVLVSLGERHAGYGVTAEHYPVVGSALLATLHKGLGDKLTEDATAAWGRTYAVIQGAMLEGSSSDGGRRLAAEYAVRQAAPTKRTDVDLVRESWALVAAGGNLAAVGELFYDVLFTAHPELADTLFRGKDMRAQASKLMAMVDAAVRLLDAPEQLVPVLVSLGERHAGYGVTAEHYPVVGSALLATLHKGLGDKLTEDATAAWGRTYAVIQGAMLEGSSSDGGRRLAAEYAVRQAAPTKRTDVDLVRESWALVAAGGNLAAVGELFYDVLFTAHPELADTLFRGKDMRAQASKLMAMVDAAVRLLDAPEQLVPVLVSLGERHAGYGVTAEHYPVVGSALLATLHKGLGDKLTEDATAAWGRTYAVIQGAMLEGSSSDGGRRLAAEYAVRQAAPTKRTDVDLVRESWALVAAGGNLAAVGELFYDVLFTAHPELADTLFRGKDMRAQASKLMAMVDAAVRLLDAPEQLVPVLVSLGERHAGYGVTAEHYPVVGSALLATLHKGLGDKLTEDATAAWGRTYAVIQGAMLEGSSSDGGRRLAAEYAVRQAAPTKRTDVDLVRESWALVAAGGNLAAVGELFYDVLFTAHPELADTLFRGKDMRAQASKLMAMVDAAVRLLDAPEQLVPVLVSLGERHAGYGVTAEHYPVVGSALLATLHKGLGDKLTEDATAAWGRTYAVIQGAMLEGSSSDAGRRLAAEYAVRQAAPTKRTDVDLVRESWALVASGGNLAAVGELFYDVLFTAHPELADTLFRGKDMRAQASKLMAMVDAAVRLLDAPEQLVPVLVSLGERHAGYGVTAEHYPVVGSALLATLHKGLGDKLTEDATAAWGRTYAVIQGAMLEGSSSDGGRRLAAEYAVRQAAPTKRTDVDLVRESWALVASGGNLAAVGELFYDVLFTAHPELADTLFRGKDMRAQASKLMAMVDAAVRLLDAPEQLVPVLVSLGERHAGYGVTAEHYPVVGSALLATLHKGLGDKLTEDATAAWGRTYAVIQGAMLEGSSSDAGRRLAAEYAVRQAAPTNVTARISAVSTPVNVALPGERLRSRAPSVAEDVVADVASLTAKELVRYYDTPSGERFCDEQQDAFVALEEPFSMADLALVVAVLRERAPRLSALVASTATDSGVAPHDLEASLLCVARFPIIIPSRGRRWSDDSAWRLVIETFRYSMMPAACRKKILGPLAVAVSHEYDRDPTVRGAVFTVLSHLLLS
jgi:hemoglobin-like flavoprotein